MKPSSLSSQCVRPQILVAAYLVSVVGVLLFIKTYLWILPRWMPATAYGSYLQWRYYLHGLTSYGFAGIAIWMATRTGNVTKQTYIVPLVLIGLSALMHALDPVFGGNSFYYQINSHLFAIWNSCLRPVLQQWIFFLIICRATGVLLKQSDSEVVPKRLSILTLMGLTGLFGWIACCKSLVSAFESHRLDGAGRQWSDMDNDF